MLSKRPLIIFVLLWLVLPAALSYAQGLPASNVTINYLEATANDQNEVIVSAYVSVTSAENQPVTGLTAENDFMVLEDGVVVPASAEMASDPMSIILMIDASGSMAAISPNKLPAIEAAKEAARSFINTLGDEDSIALYSFNDEIQLHLDLSVDHGAALNSVNMLSYKERGGTCLYDAALTAVKKAAEVPQGRRAIILLTDGLDDTIAGTPCSKHSLEDVIDEATTKTIKVPIFTVGLGKNISEQELSRLASRTGGRTLIARENAAELTNLFNIIAAQLKNQYLISYPTQAASGEHVVVVKVTKNSPPVQDEGRVFVPAPPVPPEPAPSPTPPSFAISIEDVRAGQLEEEVEIIVDVSQALNIIKSALYIDDTLEREINDPPFDRFILNTSELTPGEHIIRVEVTDAGGYTAVHKRDLTIQAPPTIPAITPTAAPNVLAPIRTFNIWPIAVIGTVLLVLLLAGVAGVVYLMRPKRGKTGVNAFQGSGNIQPTEDPLNPFLTEDTFINRRVPNQNDTVDEGPDFTRPALAQLIIKFNGLNMLRDTPSIPINKHRVIVGRKPDNGPGECDIDIPEQAVSRKHAEIQINGHSAAIRDLGSRNGTFVNDRRIDNELEPLMSGSVIRLGKEVRLQFELNSQVASDPNMTMDEGAA